jgi:hypothetical protein
MRLRIFYMPEGFGNIGYDFPAKSAPNVLDAANDGLSTDLATAKIAQLGQAVGRVGNPAVLLEDREIPLSGFGLLLSNLLASNPAITIKQGVSPLNAPHLLFLNAAGAEIARIVFRDGESVYIGRIAGNTITTGSVNILIGGNAGGGLTTGGSNIAIGGGAMQGNAGASAFNIVLGQDSLDRNGTAVGSGIVIVGHLSTNNGVQPVGNDNIFIGSSNNSTGTLASGIGIDNIIVGHANVMGGVLNNSIIIGNLKNGGPGAEMTVSNVIIIGRTDQNTLIGIPLPIVDNGNRLQVGGNIFSTGGIATAIRTTTTLAETFGATDSTIIADATAGNLNVSINPATTSQRIGNLKKKDATLNTVTLTPTSGQVFGLGAPAASISMGAQGQSITFQSDGTNIFIL